MEESMQAAFDDPEGREWFFEYLEESESGGYEASEDEIERWFDQLYQEILAAEQERWWGKLDDSFKLVRDEANVEVIEWGMREHCLSQTGAGQLLYQMHESKHRGNGAIKPASFAVRVGTERNGYLDGQAFLNLGAVLVATKRELKVYLSKRTYKAAHAYAKHILAEHGATELRKVGRPGREKYIPVLIPDVLFRYLRG
jgi:hypothetical protein